MNKLLEPTEVMISAGYQKYGNCVGGFVSVNIKAVFNAMIAKSKTIHKLLAVFEAANEWNSYTIEEGWPTRGADKLRKALEE